jgi:hypothetical protein
MLGQKILPILPRSDPGYPVKLVRSTNLFLSTILQIM